MSLRKHLKREQFPNLNPMDLPQVIGVVLEHISSVETLKSFRLVNKLWFVESLQKFRNSAVITVNKDSLQFLSYVHYLFNQDSLYMLRFLQIKEIPFKNLRFKNDFMDWMYNKEKNYQNYLCLNLMLRPAVFLDVGICKFTCSWEVLGTFKWILCKCCSSNLIELRMEPYKYSRWELRPQTNTYYGRIGFTFNYWRSFALHKCNVKTLIFTCNNRFAARHSLIPALANDVDVDREVSKRLWSFFPNLKNLSIPARRESMVLLHGLSKNKTIALETFSTTHSDDLFTQYTSELFLEHLLRYQQTVPAALSIREMSLNVRTHNCKRQSKRRYTTAKVRFLEQVIANVKDNIETLELNISYYYTNNVTDTNPIKFFENLWFDKLVNLKIILNFEKRDAIRFPVCFNFKYLFQMPNLKSFMYMNKQKYDEIWYHQDSKLDPDNLLPYSSYYSNNYEPYFDDLFSTNVANTQSKLKHLSIYMNYNSLALQQVGKWFPNVSFLELVIDDENFDACFSWENLKSLTMLPNSNVNLEDVISRRSSNVMRQDIKIICQL